MSGVHEKMKPTCRALVRSLLIICTLAYALASGVVSAQTPNARATPQSTATQSAASPQSAATPQTSSTPDADLKLLAVSVTDEYGRNVTGLGREAFSVFDADARQEGGAAATPEPHVFHVTVVDSKGNLVAGVRREDLTALDGGEQRGIVSFGVDDVPASVVFLIDTSSSAFGENKGKNGARRAAERRVAGARARGLSFATLQIKSCVVRPLPRPFRPFQ